MNQNQGPVGPDRPFKEESLNKKFSYSFTRKQLIVLANAIAPIQLPVGDPRSTTLFGILDEIRRTALQTITDEDYEKPQTAPTEPLTPEVTVN